MTKEEKLQNAIDTIAAYKDYQRIQQEYKEMMKKIEEIEKMLDNK
jgi:hypothetical protein